MVAPATAADSASRGGSGVNDMLAPRDSAAGVSIVRTAVTRTMVLLCAVAFVALAPVPARAAALDTDGDGCSDAQELASVKALGGQRNPLNPLDFADLDGDRVVSILDLAREAQSFGRAPVAPAKDFDGDSVVSILDLVRMAGQFGDSCAVTPRTYAMGWGPTPPVFNTASILATAQAMSSVSEYALVQREVPWAQLLAGATIAQILDTDQPFIDYLRSLGMKIVYLVDPLDGLDRTKEPPSLVAAGRSLLEPQILAIHEAWVRAVAQRFHPEYFGLASEINTLAAHGSTALYSTIVGMVNTLTPDIHTLDPGAKVFVSFQVEDAWQLPGFPASPVDQFKLIGDFNIDALGLSSYPSFQFAHPAAIPANYYQRFAQATSLPLIQVEGGWSSAISAWGGGTPVDQAMYVARIGALLDGVRAKLWVMLFYADLNLADPSWNVPPDRQAILQNFATMGITNTALAPKPAYWDWKRLFERPLLP